MRPAVVVAQNDHVDDEHHSLVVQGVEIDRENRCVVENQQPFLLDSLHPAPPDSDSSGQPHYSDPLAMAKMTAVMALVVAVRLPSNAIDLVGVGLVDVVNWSC